MQGCTIAPAEKSADLGSYATPEAVEFWAACLEFFRENDAASIRGTPAEIAATVGYYGEPEAAICAVADLALSTVVVQAFDADHPAGRWLEVEDAPRLAGMVVTILSTVALAEKRTQDQRRRRAASYREGRESERCSPRVSCLKSADRARPKQGELFDRLGDAPRDARSGHSASNPRENRAEPRRAPCAAANVNVSSSVSKKQYVNVRQPESGARSARRDTRDSVALWEPAARENVRRIANAITTKMREGGHPVPLEFWGNRRLILGLAALIHKGRIYEAPALEIATKAAKAENPFKYLWKAAKGLFWNQFGEDLNRELSGFKIPEKI